MATFAENLEIIRKDLIGLPVSLPWKGHGSTVFLELGKLKPLVGRQRHNDGEVCVHMSTYWRVEKGAAILFGSSNSGPEIEQGLQSLKDKLIQEINITEQVPELELYLSDGLLLRSMSMITGEPEWDIRLLNGNYAESRAGSVIIGGSSTNEVSKEEMHLSQLYDLAEKAAQRWAVPVAEPKKGKCNHCLYHIRLDGKGHMLDYGVCVSKDSAFDGKIVHLNSGCPVYASKNPADEI